VKMAEYWIWTQKPFLLLLLMVLDILLKILKK
jgi:hypothetical protein